MTSAADPNEQNFEDAAAQLGKGLKSCRALVSGYRQLLSGDNDTGQAGFNDPGERREQSAA